MPIVIVLFFVGLLYVKLKEPADAFFGWITEGIISGIRAIFSLGKEKAVDPIITGTEIVFE